MTTTSAERKPAKKVAKATTAAPPPDPAMDEIIVMHDEIARHLKKQAKKKAKKAKNMFLRAIEWVKDKARRAWRWFTGKVRAGAKWLKKKLKNGWARTKRVSRKVWNGTKKLAKRAWNATWRAIKWSWNSGVALVAATTTPVRVAAGTVLGVAWVTTFGVPILVAAAIGWIAYWLIAGESPSTSVKKARRKAKARKRVKEAEAEAIETMPELNTEQERALMNLVVELTNEHQKKVEKGITVMQNSSISGQTFYVLRWAQGSRQSVNEVYTEYKRRMDGAWEDFHPQSVKTGMKIAESKVNKLLIQHQDQNEPETV
jgi:hypothetical protein